MFYSTVLKTDLQQVGDCMFIPWEKLRGKTVLITGATGLIGRNIIWTLLWANMRKNLNLTMVALVRDQNAAKERFSGAGQALRFAVGCVESLPDIPEDVDYIIHGASPTASAYFLQCPIETVRTAVVGTWNLLELGRQKNTEGFLYLSSMEVYGANISDEPINENAPSFIDSMNVRNCYPEAKRLCENLCAGYWREYGVPAKVIRLAQTFGPGIAPNDDRVFAQFLRASLKKEDIILKTEGSSKRSYLYTADGVSAILTVLLCGKSGEAYNAANPDTYCSILEVAEMVARDLAQGDIRVKIQADGAAAMYPPSCRLNLQVDKLMALGWRPTRKLREMFERMAEDMLERSGDAHGTGKRTDFGGLFPLWTP